MDILPATKENLEEVVSWINTEEECRLWAGPAVTFPVMLATLCKEISFAPDNSFACISEQGLLAFGQVIKKADGYSHLARIIANPEFRGQGLGRKICTKLVDYASSAATGKISLNVYRHNEVAVSLYESLGFREQVDKSDPINVFMIKPRD